MKSSKKRFIFLSAFYTTNYVPHEITKFFWKNSHFENMTADFFLRCQKSLRQEISLICHWIIDFCKQMLSFGYVMVPKNYPRIMYNFYRLQFVRMIAIREPHWQKTIFVMPENALFQCWFAEVSLWSKPAVIFSKWLFFQNSLVIS